MAWIEDEAVPAPGDTSWQDAGWNAVQSHLAGGEAETHLENLAGGDPNADDAPDLTAMFLSGQGLDYSNATPDEVYAAALQADEWHAKALAQLGVNDAARIDVASAADSVSLENKLNEWVDTHAGGNPATALPYIDLAFEAMEEGAGFDEAMAQASAALGKWTGEVNEAAREQQFAGLGLQDGMAAAFAARRANAAPQHRSNGHGQKAVPAQPTHAHNLGSTDASQAQISNSLSAFTQGLREKQAVKDLAKQHVRTPPPAF
jgi:hypothetical protein